MRIITGYTGNPDNVTSNAAQGFHQGIFGTGNCILNVGNRLQATLTDATTVTLSDGEGVMQGVHFRIDPGTTESVTISAGTTGYNRIDLICARYTKDTTTGIEAVNLVAIEGTPAVGDASAPAYNTGDILTGATIVDFPLWWVILVGISPTLQMVAKLYHNQETLLALADSSTRCDSEVEFTSDTMKPGIYMIRVNCTTSYSAVAEIAYQVRTYIGDDDPIWEKFQEPTNQSSYIHQFVYPAIVQANDASRAVRVKVQSFTSSGTGYGQVNIAIYATRIM